MTKICQNGDKHEHLDQVDMIGGRGPIGRHRPAPPGTSLASYHVSVSWEHLLNQ
jgi:hypothetical protein